MVRIVADSTCDLPAHLVARYGISIVPLYINMGSESLLDGVELSREEFSRQRDHPVPAGGPTSRPTCDGAGASQGPGEPGLPAPQA